MGPQLPDYKTRGSDAKTRTTRDWTTGGNRGPRPGAVGPHRDRRPPALQIFQWFCRSIINSSSDINMIAVLFVVLLAVAAAQTYDNVLVEVYYEALCPGCQSFITGPLTNTLALPDMEAIIDLKMVPYGNTKANADGTFTCQHGTDECVSDVLQSCVLYKVNNNITDISTGVSSKKAWPFLQCMEIHSGASSYAASCYADNIIDDLAYEIITDCADNEASVVQNAGKAATPADHQYTPWILVDGVLLQYTNLFLQAVCKAYTGPSPASCKSYEPAPTVCLNLD